jgi:hypothetical protein
VLRTAGRCPTQRGDRALDPQPSTAKRLAPLRLRQADGEPPGGIEDRERAQHDKKNGIVHVGDKRRHACFGGQRDQTTRRVDCAGTGPQPPPRPPALLIPARPQAVRKWTDLDHRRLNLPDVVFMRSGLGGVSSRWGEFQNDRQYYADLGRRRGVHRQLPLARKRGA